MIFLRRPYSLFFCLDTTKIGLPAWMFSQFYVDHVEPCTFCDFFIASSTCKCILLILTMKFPLAPRVSPTGQVVPRQNGRSQGRFYPKPLGSGLWWLRGLILEISLRDLRGRSLHPLTTDVREPPGKKNKKKSSFYASYLLSSLTSCCPYTTSKGKGGKYLKQVSNGDLLVEVWISLLEQWWI